MQRLFLQGFIPVNCYVLEHNHHCFIVDPGYNKDKIIDYVHQRQLKVLGILLTHGHLDHIGAIDAFDVPIYIHESDISNFNYAVEHRFEYYGLEVPFDLAKITLTPLYDKQQLDCAGELIHIIHTPGHTIGGVCYLFKNELYSGDTLFANTVGKWDYSTGDKEQLKASVLQLIEELPLETIVCPGHGRSTTIGQEKLQNPFYLEWKKM